MQIRPLLVLALIAAPALPAQEPYHITQTWTVGGDGGWDYVVPDSPNHRIFVARQTREIVVDTRDGRLLGAIDPIHGAHGVALSPHHGFATSGNDSSVIVFDPVTLAAQGRIPAAEDADAIIYDPASGRVFTFNGDAHSSTVIDGNQARLITNIPLGGKPESGVSAGDGKVYVNLVDNAEVVEIDARALTVTRRWSTAPCAQPVSMAIDVAHHRLFSGCRSGVMAVSDYAAGRIVTTVPIGSGVDGAGYDPAAGDVFCSNADGTLTIIHQDGADQYHVLQTLQTGPYGRNLGLDPATHRIYVATARFEPMPADSATTRRRRPPMVPGSFAILVIGRAAPAR